MIETDEDCYTIDKIFKNFKMLNKRIKGSSSQRTHEHKRSSNSFSLDKISDEYVANKSMHDYSKVKKLPQVFTVATPVRKNEYCNNKIAGALRCKSKLTAKDNLANNYPSQTNLPNFFNRRNESLDKINEMGKRIGLNIPRSFSQPRHKSISHARSIDAKLFNNVGVQQTRLKNSLSEYA